MFLIYKKPAVRTWPSCLQADCWSQSSFVSGVAVDSKHDKNIVETKSDEVKHPTIQPAGKIQDNIK